MANSSPNPTHPLFSAGTFLVTGASGFVGRALCVEMLRLGLPVRAAVRADGVERIPRGCAIARIDELSAATDWSEALRGVGTVIHLAARVHVMHENARDPLAEFRKTNVEATVHLARQAVERGVRRLVFVSSIKVNGEATEGARRYSEADAPAPVDAYGISKWEAEKALQQIAAETGIEVVVLRPPLVYGPGVKGNFASMLGVLRRGVPLPLASVSNGRSLVYVGNLVDALLRCATHPDAAGQTYLVSDGEELSTPNLLRRLGEALGRPARLWPCPPALLLATARLLGRGAQMERLLGSLRVDDRKIRRELGWAPPYSVADGLKATVE